MSLEYCHDCDNMIDLDWNLEHEHFQQLVMAYANHNKIQKGGKENEKRRNSL